MYAFGRPNVMKDRVKLHNGLLPVRWQILVV
jgi:hypothetical protein